MTTIRNARGDIITEPTDIRRLMRERYGGVMSINLTTEVKWLSSLKNINYQNCFKKKQTSWENSPSAPQDDSQVNHPLKKVIQEKANDWSRFQNVDEAGLFWQWCLLELLFTVVFKAIYLMPSLLFFSLMHSLWEFDFANCGSANHGALQECIPTPGKELLCTTHKGKTNGGSKDKNSKFSYFLDLVGETAYRCEAIRRQRETTYNKVINYYQVWKSCTQARAWTSQESGRDLAKKASWSGKTGRKSMCQDMVAGTSWTVSRSGEESARVHGAVSVCADRCMWTWLVTF